MRPGPSTSVPGLVLAGAWTDTGWPATLEGAVLSGHAAAAAVVAGVGATQKLTLRANLFSSPPTVICPASEPV